MTISDNIEAIRNIVASLDDDDPDKLELINNDGQYAEIIEWALQKRSEALAVAEANKSLVEQYRARQKQHENKAENLKSLITTFLNTAGETAYKGTAGTVTIRPVKPKPVVVDESKLPDRFVKRVQDKAAINDAKKAGEDVPGVSMDNGGYTTIIRVK